MSRWRTTSWPGIWGGAGAQVPTGALLDFAGSSAPAGYLFCDGASYAAASYPALFAAIGYTYGGAAANFNVPDLRARTKIGVNNAGLPNGENGSFSTRDLANTPGAESPGTGGGSAHAHGMNSHVHTIGDDGGHQHEMVFTGAVVQNGGGSFIQTDAEAAHDHSGSTGTGTGDTADESAHTHPGSAMQPSLVLNSIIKV